jgi:hypothetical protein
MTGYTSVFGGQNIFPAQLTFLALAPTANVTLQWPTEVALPGANVFPNILELVPAAGLSVTFPDAMLAGPGQSILINNVGANTISILDAGGNNIGSVASGEVWEFYLQDNTTADGVWRTFEYGAGASSAVAAALAGAGLKAILTTLNVKIDPRTSAVSPLVLANSDRARVVVWTGGVGAGTLPDPAVVGNDWFAYIRNNGSGTWTLTPTAGTIDGQATLALGPDNSAIVYTDGTDYFTIGLTRTTATGFDFTGINIAGSGDYTLSGAELNRIAYRLTGILSGNRNVIVPNQVQQYWVNNATTGAFTGTIKTALGLGITVVQGQSMLLYCDGTDVIAAEGAPTTGLLATERGGTGLPTYAQGDLIYATAAQVLARLAKDANATRYLSNTGASNAPAWAQVNLANGVTGQLPFANIADLSGTSVFGRASNSVGVGGPIAGTNSQVLRVNNAGTLLGFGQVDLSQPAAVIGTLPIGLGGTGLTSYAQGDILYASALNTLASLAKYTTRNQPLMNTGTNNAPTWGPFSVSVQTPLAASYTLAQGNQNWVLQYESAGTTTVEIPENANEAFPEGTIIPFVNGGGAGVMTFAPLGAVTLYAKGQVITNPGTFVLPAGFNAILWKVATDTWSLLTDSPATSGAGTTYAGYVAAAAASSQFNPAATGWVASNPGVGVTRITHNLGLASANDLAITPAMVSAADDRPIMVTALNVNFFEYTVNDIGSGPVDVPTFFTAVRLV